jgi:hypothetical protein
MSETRAPYGDPPRLTPAAIENSILRLCDVCRAEVHRGCANAILSCCCDQAKEIHALAALRGLAAACANFFIADWTEKPAEMAEAKTEVLRILARAKANGVLE